MAKSDVSVRREVAKLVFAPLATITSGVFLLSLGVAINQQSRLPGLQTETLDLPRVCNMALLPIGAGAILNFVAGAQLSAVLRPPYMLLLGAALTVGANFGLIAVDRIVLPVIDDNWVVVILTFLFVFRIVGLMFFLADLPRLFRERNRKSC